MVKSHGRKQTARRRAAGAGGGHQAAVEQLKARTTAGGRAGQASSGRRYLVADLPVPDLAGAAACPACRGVGNTGDHYEIPGDDERVLLAPVVCRSCGGCGRAEHEDCAPLHIWNDPDETQEWLADLDDQAWENDGEEPERCPSCQGKRFNFQVGFGADTAESQAAYAELLRRAEAKGLSERDIDAAAAFGELDQVLGNGARALAETSDTTVYLRVACGCAKDEVRQVHSADLERAMTQPAGVPKQQPGVVRGRVYEVQVGETRFIFQGCPDLGAFGMPQHGSQEVGQMVIRERPDQPGVCDGFVLDRKGPGVAVYRWVTTGTPEEVLPQVLTALAVPVSQRPPVMLDQESTERQVVYADGPWDGEVRSQPKVFWPPQNQMVTNGGDVTHAWPDAWPADLPRYMPVPGTIDPLRMVWAAPVDPGAPRVIERPESVKDYADED
ncbi:hypothetical protein ACFQ0M_47670 [Kitasatospora aburaviensis]|uniref:Uncharacterized protein n=1 Tax=Kitasatospora aburaviensis TaxID=67265 RepID=A0ABW1EYJ4_9ACTN